ncbi:ABC transporter ATP-binding protein [Rathayibacter iranicus]|uniref:ABC transporter ATP-binding protein n=2 Tax=Rathayibacter iranicus TaxID=59737 RepID=A0AAD1ADH6_9MICO|nr:ABC transporter ATP-binding protein [Rathayibacter iranicus]AZZ54669.1 ABC transporter ATP-binding protein [Rathayibacter iranicus]MWV30455.1 ATP-binding cassette domain-containing protein [Rathayibacter iranicus NCPPB 2253 = VKM Ac-1602]PPI51108.1 ABC transporter ATP-binding protein [Rathayibacter iranicus]PPI63448.1 ABC transporter ATP-binding protein [Rathayibacter iranicus]PPI74158.1 ABC transporter ATP-binding protein [Rathayibacter iranicus]
MRPISGALVRADGATVRFGSFTALDGITCAFSGTGVHGLIGVNGAGKTTLIHALLGLIPVISGRIERGSGEIAYCPDTPSFEPFLTPLEVMAQSARLGTPTHDVATRRAIRDVLARVGLDDATRRRVGGFSRGMKQRLGIAAALVRKPSLLILDEPTSALDPVGREAILEIVRSLGREMCVVISSHILTDVDSVADRLVVLDHGRLVFAGDKGGFIESASVRSSIVVSSFEDASGLRARLAAAGVAAEPALGSARELLVPMAAVEPLLAVIAHSSRDIRSISFGENSLQQAFMNRIGTPADAGAGPRS